MRQVSESRADDAAQLIRDDLKVAKRRGFLDEWVAHFIKIFAELQGHGMFT